MLPTQKQPHIIQGVVGFGSLPRGSFTRFQITHLAKLCWGKALFNSCIHQTSPAPTHSWVFIELEWQDYKGELKQTRALKQSCSINRFMNT